MAAALEPKLASARPPNGAELHRSRSLTGTAYELAGPSDWGWAVIGSDQDGPHLQGTREADGTILTCWISNANDSDAEWAVDVWRSVQSSATSKPRGD